MTFHDGELVEIVDMPYFTGSQRVYKATIISAYPTYCIIQYKFLDSYTFLVENTHIRKIRKVRKPFYKRKIKEKEYVEK